ncbi:Mysoin-binding motif of peroxisomes-domain-containing protein [Lipomyces arxii]|uniref:Mysoin-binding motif of peroxisomes-domain-containing protein n=1 Tax=Lipomyces arxii TaxID=56418 RepID=UPI0034CDF4F2
MPAEQVVFKDSPLGDYFTESGDDITINGSQQLTPTVSEGWESSASEVSLPVISDQEFSVVKDITPKVSNKSQFKGSNTELKPLILGNEHSMRRLRFQYLFTTPLRKKLGPRENSRFLERFRYILVTSQLLHENVSVFSRGRKLDDGSELFPSEKAQKVLTARNATRYWAGSGGCIVVIAILFSWLLRSGDRYASAKCRLLVSLVLVTSVSLFFYAHAWRKRLRFTRMTAIEYATQFIECNQAFDNSISRTIGLVQEVEFVSHGFKFPNIAYNTPTKLSVSMSKIINQKSSLGNRRCKALRSQISSVLDLSYSLYRRSVDVLSELCNHSDLAKYLDIYDLNQSPTVENKPVEESGEDTAESLWKLKQQFKQLHRIRRKLICCLLAMDSRGDTRDVYKWKVVIQELRTLSDLVKKLSEDMAQSLEQEDVSELAELCSSRLEEEQTDSHSQRSSPAAYPNAWRSHLRTLRYMSATLRNVEAKLYALREDSATLERQESRAQSNAQNGPSIRPGIPRTGLGLSFGAAGSPKLQRSSDILMRQYDSLGSDLKSLVKDWETGRQRLQDAVMQTPGRSQQAYGYDSPASSTMSSPDSLVSGTTFESQDTPWSPKSTDEHSFVVHSTDDDDEGYDGDGVEVSMAVKAKMVESVASAMVRQQERILSLR